MGDKRQRLFLSSLKGCDQQDWIEKKFITDAALQDFYEKH
jgi:hypothetical protein